MNVNSYLGNFNYFNQAFKWAVPSASNWEAITRIVSKGLGLFSKSSKEALEGSSLATKEVNLAPESTLVTPLTPDDLIPKN